MLDATDELPIDLDGNARSRESELDQQIRHRSGVWQFGGLVVDDDAHGWRSIVRMSAQQLAVVRVPALVPAPVADLQLEFVHTDRGVEG